MYAAPDRPASLYEGLAGAVCLWADVLAVTTVAAAASSTNTEGGPVIAFSAPLLACFPGYELS